MRNVAEAPSQIFPVLPSPIPALREQIEAPGTDIVRVSPNFESKESSPVSCQESGNIQHLMITYTLTLSDPCSKNRQYLIK